MRHFCPPSALAPFTTSSPELVIPLAFALFQLVIDTLHASFALSYGRRHIPFRRFFHNTPSHSVFGAST